MVGAVIRASDVTLNSREQVSLRYLIYTFYQQTLMS